jgi:hypothetical protein
MDLEARQLSEQQKALEQDKSELEAERKVLLALIAAMQDSNSEQPSHQEK